ncbi:MAG: ABC transporter substrate-binding protein [Gammaproteobacteria bacterium]
MRGTRTCLATIVAVCLLAACGGSDDDDPADDPAEDSSSGSITIALEQEPTTLDAQHTQDGQMRRVAENIFERLIDRDIDDPTVLVPRLAADLPTLIDDVTWEIKIKEGVTFTNGEPFDAAAAAAAINRQLDPDFDSELLGLIEIIEDVEVVDDTTLRLTTNGPDPILPSRLYMIQMVPPEYSQTAEFARSPIGTGPYEFVEWVPGSHIDLQANPDYWGDAPALDSARFVFLGENQSRLAALQAGEVDLAVGLAPETADSAPQLITRKGLEHPYLRFKTYEGPAASPELRQAAAHALNIDAYIETIYDGQAERVQCQPIGSESFGFNPDLQDYEYDPERARELVEASGYGGESIRMLAPTGRWSKFEELSEVAVADLSEVGINVALESVPFDPWLEGYRIPIGEGQPDIVLGAFSTEILDADKASQFLGSRGGNSSYANDQLSDTMDEARVTLDEEEREALYHEALATNCEEVGLLPLLSFLDIYGASETLDWQPRFDGTTRIEEMALG